MQKFKKVLAAALATTMVFGSSIVAFAEDPETSGSTEGAGASEGHVDKEVVNVILPTVAEGSTPFAYTMDPERLIKETDAAKYTEGTVFPEEDADTGVYFLTDTNTYASESNTLQIINKSSVDVTVTVTVQAEESGDKDIALAANADTLTATEDDVTTPLLYLGLKYGADTKPLTAEEQEFSKTIAGTDGNYEVAVDDDAYVYQVKEDATEWKAINISMVGAVGEASVAEDTTAPTIKVTWAYEQAEEDAEVDTDDQVTFSDEPAAPANAAPSIASTATFTIGEELRIPANLGAGELGATAISSVKVASSKTGTYSTTDKVTISGSNVVIASSAYSTAAGSKRYVKVQFNDTAKTTLIIEVSVVSE